MFICTAITSRHAAGYMHDICMIYAGYMNLESLEKNYFLGYTKYKNII